MNLHLHAVNKYLKHTQLNESSSIIERARQVAVQAHIEQTRWNGDAYITHPMRVAAAVNTDDEKVVAYLHDAVEDTELELEDLRTFGFSEKQIEAVDSVTKDDDESYLDFVLRAEENSIGCIVKIADIKDNLRDLTRKNKTMRDKYELALYILENYR